MSLSDNLLESVLDLNETLKTARIILITGLDECILLSKNVVRQFGIPPLDDKGKADSLSDNSQQNGFDRVRSIVHSQR
jgi:hypothetical protein